MNNSLATSGNSGPKVRSDCEVVLELRNEGGVIIDLKSKVEVLYGESIKKQCLEILDYFGIRDAFLKIVDSGALPFVIASRMESAIKQLTGTKLDFLPEFLEGNGYSTARGNLRLSRLYLPGNTPSMMINAGLHHADGIILDLEDSVAPEKKDEARILVRNALRQVNFYGAERMVRINQGERGLKDLECVIPHNVNLVLIPKCEDPLEVKNIENKILEINQQHGLTNPVHLMPIVETALGVEMSYMIARSSETIAAMAIGLEDLTADMGISRSVEGWETFYARTRIINAAKAAGIQPIDSVFADVGDMETLRQNVQSSKRLGFEGMGCIHPRQIPVIREGYGPTAGEIEKSRNILLAFEDSRKKGLGVVALGTKMIDAPVVARAQKTIDLAIRLGLISTDWINDIQSEVK